MENLTEKYLWVEKYRPKMLDDLILPDEYRKTFSKYISDLQIPNLLLLGVQGSGKTTLAQILIRSLLEDVENCLCFNGSTSTGVDVVRNNIEEFLKVPSFSGSCIKIVFIDEFDYMSGNAMAALRNMMEKYSDTGRFLFTANYKSKIIGPIISRVTMFEFKKLPIAFVQKYCYNILENEKIEYDKNFVDKLINMYYPDIRRIVNTLQGKMEDGRIISDYNSLISREKQAHSYILDLCEGLKKSNNSLISKSILNTHNILRDGELDYISLYQGVYEDSNIPVWAKIIINRYANDYQNCLIPPMHWCAMVYEVGKVGKEFYKLTRK